MADCLFCGIVAGTEPAEILFEDEDAIAFLDIGPATEGHTLVVPRHHCVDLFDIGEERAGTLMRTAVEVAELLKVALQPAGMNMVHASGAAAWQSVFHFHLHLIPRYRIDELTPPWPIGRTRADGNELTAVAERIRAIGLG
ncbi:MAG TPA: HIT family protein [Actinomycetota bacterium]